MQSCLSYPNFVTKSLWEAMQTLDDGTLIQMMCSHMEDLGLVFANSPTYVVVGCVVELARLVKADQDKIASGLRTDPYIHIDVPMTYSFIEKLKAQLRLNRAHLRYAHYGACQMYPTMPEALENQFPDIYQRVYRLEGPTPSIVDEILLRSLSASVPCRKTHRALRMSRLMDPLHGSMVARHMRPMLPPSSHIDSMRQSTADQHELPGLQIFRNHGQSGHQVQHYHDQGQSGHQVQHYHGRPAPAP